MGDKNKEVVVESTLRTLISTLNKMGSHWRVLNRKVVGHEAHFKSFTLASILYIENRL